ncbi:hypothetical protein FGIG_01621 [Fasciola gigantica]|uniref:Uncharacterized protein n=1 Tax=Fasciola gigantica TaxID=46835 RepID=A0A504YTG9_FASGI|nr:hypothetical protein FGIG_01621 [Fasciola gigantica]
MSHIIDSEIRSKLPPKKDLTDEAVVKDSAPKQELTKSECTDTENKRIAIETSDSEYANPFDSTGEQEPSASSAKSPTVDGRKNNVDQKEYQTVEAQTRIPSHALTLDASSDHHQKTPYPMGQVSAKTPSQNPVKMEPVTSSDHSSKESGNRVQLHEHTPKKEEDESNSKNSRTSVPTVTLSISNAPVAEDKKASFHISGWQWSVNDQNENTKITQPKTLVSGAGPMLPLAAPISNLLELIRNHENSIWKQTKKLVSTKYVYDGPGYPSLHGVNCVLQRLWTDAEFFAFPTPPQERLKEKLEDIEELQTHLVDLYSNPKLIGELRTVIEQYKGSSRLGLDSITSRIETCSQWLRAKSKEVRKEYAEMYKLIREDAIAYKRFLIERQGLLYGALDEFLGTLDEPEIFIKAIRESEAESSSADYQTLKERENWKLPRFRLRNAYSMYTDNTTRTLVRTRHAMVAWKGPRAYTN